MSLAINLTVKQQSEPNENDRLLKANTTHRKVQELSNFFAVELVEHVNKYVPNKFHEGYSFSLGLRANFYPSVMLIERIPQDLSVEFQQAQRKVNFFWNEVAETDHDNIRRMIADRTVKKVMELMKELLKSKGITSSVTWEASSSGSFFGLLQPDSITIGIRNKGGSLFF